MIRWGIIGAGNIAKRFTKSLLNSQEGVLYAVASQTKENLEAWKQEYPDIKAYQDYDALLDDENVDVVYIATWHSTHYQWAKKSLLKGKAVLCEKPATLKKAEIEDLVCIAKEKNVLFVEGMKTRFIPMVIELKKLLGEGLIGDIQEVHNRFCYDITHVENTRYLFDKEQGGILNDVGSYTIASLLDYIQSPIQHIDARCTWEQGVDIHDYVEVTFENGSKGYMEMAMDENKEPLMQIKGTLGMIECCPFYRPQEILVTLHEKEPYTIKKEYQYDDFFTEIEEVHYCIKHHLIESSKMTLQNSIECIALLEDIQNKIKKN